MVDLILTWFHQESFYVLYFSTFCDTILLNKREKFIFQINESGGGNSFFTQQKIAFSNLAVNVREMENSKSRK